MKPIIPFALLGAFFAVGAAKAASTPPVGYYEHAAVAGGNLVIPSLVQPAAYSGVLTGASGSTMTVAANSFTAGAFDEGTYATHYVVITSGPNAGTGVDIVSNDGNILTLADDITGLSLSGTESITIRPHNTVKSIFSNASSQGLLVPFSDTVTLYLPNGSSVSYNYGVLESPNEQSWSSDFATPDGDDVPVPPGTGFVLNVGADVDLPIVGEAIDEPTVVQLATGVVNICGPMNPLVGETIPLGNTGWGALVPFQDTITLYDQGPLVAPIAYDPFGNGVDLTSDFGMTATTDTIAATVGGVVIPGGGDVAITLNPDFTIVE